MKSLGPDTGGLSAGIALLWCLNVPCGATPLIAVELQPDTPRHILFPQAIRLGVPASSPLQAEVLEEHLWLKSPDLKGDKLRLLVHTADTALRWILEVSTSTRFATPSAAAVTDSGTLRIPPSTPSAAAVADSGTLRIPSSTRESGRQERHWHYVRLARWVLQQIYSPRRLLSPLPGAVRYPLQPAPLHLMRCSPAGQPACPSIHNSPLAAWRYRHPDTGVLHITAVELQNAEAVPIVLNPERLRGRWLAVSFSDRQLAAAGQLSDSSVVLLISPRPLMEVLQL